MKWPVCSNSKKQKTWHIIWYNKFLFSKWSWKYSFNVDLHENIKHQIHNLTTSESNHNLDATESTKTYHKRKAIKYRVFLSPMQLFCKVEKTWKHIKSKIERTTQRTLSKKKQKIGDWGNSNHPSTMMIKACNTTITYAAMFGSSRSKTMKN